MADSGSADLQTNLYTTETIFERRTSNDIFRTALWDVSSQEWSEVGNLNFYDANESWASPYFSNVFVMSVLASELGLSEQNSTFSVWGASRFSRRLAAVRAGEVISGDETERATYNIKSPRVSTILDGESQFPIPRIPSLIPFSASLPMDPAIPSPSLLVIRHDNLPQESHEIITLNSLAPFPDDDQDGLSNDFETRYFGSSTAGRPTLDPDRDGFSNLSEFQAGTNPLDHQSFLQLTIAQNGSSLSISETSLGHLYQIDRSPALRQFSPMIRNIFGNGSPIQIPINPSNPQEFFQLQATKPLIR